MQKSVPAGHGALHLNALTLGIANAIDYGIQFILPIVLTRVLDPHAFGQYRLLWLMISTVMALAPLAMPTSLYYYLPRSDDRSKRLFINQALLFLVVTGAIGAAAGSAVNPWLPAAMREISAHDSWVPVFIWLWVVASLIDFLPTAEERVQWQSRAIVGLSATRALMLTLTAMTTHSFFALVIALAAFAALRLALLLRYISRYHGFGGPWLNRNEFASQIRYALPFGVSGALYSLRVQADQWVAAMLFSVNRFAAFSVGSVLSPVLYLFRQSVNNAFLPSMNRLHAQGDVIGAVKLNNRANISVALLAYPLLGFCFVFAEQVITLIYTAPYVDAAAVMRVYTFGLLAYAVELSSIMLINRQGTFVMLVNLASLVFSAAGSYLGALKFGLAGAAAGSVFGIYLERCATLMRISSLIGIPIRDLQDWRSLCLIAVAAAISGTVSWILKGYISGSGAIAQLALGAVIFTSAYVVLLLAFGFGEAFVNLARLVAKRGG
ncbi:MAG TPA: oligosaccharide flippase family protein [Burkholderiales bacterium]|nr:oligosaccharide flippase family protein [Burkholderiales bacterium]